MDKKLYRSRKNEKLFGVCAGLADYFDVDVTLIRVLTVISAFLYIGFIPYIVCALVIPVNPNESYHPNNYNEFDDFNDKKQSPDHTKKIIGVIAIFIGMSMILEKIFSFISFKFIFSVILIFIGISLLASFKHKK